MIPRLTSNTFPSFINDGDSFFHSVDKAISAHNEPRDSSARKSSNSITVAKQILPHHHGTLSNLPSTPGIPLAVMMTVDASDFSDGMFHHN